MYPRKPYVCFHCEKKFTKRIFHAKRLTCFTKKTLFSKWFFVWSFSKMYHHIFWCNNLFIFWWTFFAVWWFLKDLMNGANMIYYTCTLKLRETSSWLWRWLIGGGRELCSVNFVGFILLMWYGFGAWAFPFSRDFFLTIEFLHLKPWGFL